MKKLTLICVCLVFLLCSCGEISNSQNNSGIATTQELKKDSTTVTRTGSSKEEIEVKESAYTTYINEIYSNIDSYLGATITIEGVFRKTQTNGKTYNEVYRTDPGCCGNDGSVLGFEFSYDKDLPENGEWVKVVGTVYSYSDGEYDYPAINAKSVKVMDTRGKATVSN